MTKRILIADDNNEIRRQLMMILTMEGYSVSAVDNGLDLLRLAGSSSKFDLLITDIVMPKGEGNDMLALLRRKGITTPAIVLTGHDLPVPPDTLVIPKPFRVDHVLRTVAAILDMKPEPANV